MKKFTFILILVAAIICGYAAFYLAVAFLKVIIGAGFVLLLVGCGYIGFKISKLTNKANKS